MASSLRHVVAALKGVNAYSQVLLAGVFCLLGMAQQYAPDHVVCAHVHELMPDEGVSCMDITNITRGAGPKKTCGVSSPKVQRGGTGVPTYPIGKKISLVSAFR